MSNGKSRHRSIDWERVRGSVLISPLLFTGLLAMALINVGQFREIYVAAAQPESFRALLLGMGGMALLSITLFFGYIAAWIEMRKAGIGFGGGLVYRNLKEISTDQRMILFRDLAALICALAPLVAVGVGFGLAGNELVVKLSVFDNAVRTATLDDQAMPRALLELPNRLWAASWGWFFLTLVVGLLILGYGRTEVKLMRNGIPRIVARARMRDTIPWPAGACAAAMIVGPPVMLWLAPEWFNDVFRWLGPLATVAAMLVALATILFLLGNASHRTGIPWIGLILGAILFIGILNWLGSSDIEQIQAQPVRSDRQPVAEQRARNVQSAGAQASYDVVQPDLATAPAKLLATWLRNRKDIARFNGKRYPVFIIAAQGGGIYAASAAAHFLAKMQDACENFSQHVFAISAVSGGAIGSTLFGGATAGLPQTDSVDCGEPPAPNRRFTRLLGSVVRDDHLSASVAATLPDLLVKLGLLSTYHITKLVNATLADAVPSDVAGRAEALECSFLVSFTRWMFPGAAGPEGCRTSVGRTALNKAFSDSWRSASNLAAPALVLNTTRAETGDRVAFAPFSLQPVGDQTLYSFSELKDAKAGVTLLEAAVTSARFPGMLPAKILPYSQPSDGRTHWRNFVDGGYADASGATTALEIYKSLDKELPDVRKQLLERDKLDIDIDLRLILLTDAPASNATDRAGEGLIHAISPLITLFTVRSQIARRAVYRAQIELLDPEQAREAATESVALRYNCSDHDWRVRLVVLDQKRFELPLAWMLSAPTSHIVGGLVGVPRNLGVPPVTPANLQPTAERRTADLLYDNSCTMWSMTQLLSAKVSRSSPQQATRQ